MLKKIFLLLTLMVLAAPLLANEYSADKTVTYFLNTNNLPDKPGHYSICFTNGPCIVANIQIREDREAAMQLFGLEEDALFLRDYDLLINPISLNALEGIEDLIPDNRWLEMELSNPYEKGILHNAEKVACTVNGTLCGIGARRSVPGALICALGTAACSEYVDRNNQKREELKRAAEEERRQRAQDRAERLRAHRESRRGYRDHVSRTRPGESYA